LGIDLGQSYICDIRARGLVNGAGDRAALQSIGNAGVDELQGNFHSGGNGVHLSKGALPGTAHSVLGCTLGTFKVVIEVILAGHRVLIGIANL